MPSPCEEYSGPWEVCKTVNWVAVSAWGDVGSRGSHHTSQEGHRREEPPCSVACQEPWAKPHVPSDRRRWSLPCTAANRGPAAARWRSSGRAGRRTTGCSSQSPIPPLSVPHPTERGHQTGLPYKFVPTYTCACHLEVTHPMLDRDVQDGVRSGGFGVGSLRPSLPWTTRVSALSVPQHELYGPTRMGFRPSRGTGQLTTRPSAFL